MSLPINEQYEVEGWFNQNQTMTKTEAQLVFLQYIQDFW